MSAEIPIILYIEDEESDATLMQMAFAKEGLGESLRTVGDGQAAIDYLSGADGYADRKTHPLPQVVLLDLNLPEVHGFDVLKWIRSSPEHRSLPVVVFSSSNGEADQNRARLLAADDFVQKPSSPALFRNLVCMLKNRWLGGPVAAPVAAAPEGKNMSIRIPAPTERLANCIWLPRILAKARLLEKGQLPAGYAARFGHPQGVDGLFLGYFHLKSDDIVEAARQADDAVVIWFCSRPEGTPENIEKWNETALNAGRPGYPMSERFQVAKETVYKHVYKNGMTTVFELLEADDKLE